LSTDWYTRLVLTVIAVCLALMVVHGFRSGAGAGASGPEEDRYRLTPLPLARLVLRFDAETGKTWKAMFPDLNSWAPIADSPAELLEQVIAETPKAPAPEAPAPSEGAPAEPVTP
jgi:hypothetical protein